MPYSNGEIHLGHIASTYLPADIFARFLRLKGKEVYYVCASDDFGTPVLIKAEEQGKNPEEYVHSIGITEIKRILRLSGFPSMPFQKQALQLISNLFNMYSNYFKRTAIFMQMTSFSISVNTI